MQTPDAHAHERLSSNRIQVTTFCALMGLCQGVSMSYVPYLFGTPGFRLIYENIRLLGLAFLLGGGLIAFASIAPRGGRWAKAAGSLLLFASQAIFALYLYRVSRGTTGLVFYGICAVFLAAEALAPSRRHALFPSFMALLSALLGAELLFGPVTENLTASVPALIKPLGVAFLAGAGAVSLTRKSPQGGAARAAFTALGLFFVVMAYGFGVTRVWSGLLSYAVSALACALVAWSPRIPAALSFRRRLLGSACVAAFVPLLALGGLATFLAQRTIQEQLSMRLQEAADAQAELMHARMAPLRDALAKAAREPSVLRVRAGVEGASLVASLEDVWEQMPEPAMALLVDERGHVIAHSLEHHSVALPDPAWLRERMHPGSGDTARAMAGPDGHSMVMVAPIAEEHGGGALVGVFAARAFLEDASHKAAHYTTQLIDAKSGTVLADSSGGQVVSGPELLRHLATDALLHGEVAVEGLDASGRPVLAADARVDRTGLLIITLRDLVPAYAPVTRLGAAVVALLIIAAGMAVFLAETISRELSRGLLHIRDATVEIASGQLDARVGEHDMAELSDLARAFNRMVSRTEAAQKDLSLANEDLRDALRLRDQFVSMASHELRTPLTSLQLGLEMAQRSLDKPPDQADPSRARRSLQMMSRQLERLITLTNDLLDVARLRAGRMPIEPVSTDLVHLVGEALEKFTQGAPASTSTVLFDAPDGAMMVEADPARVDQVVVNLVQNALKYSPSGSAVRVSVAEEPDGARITVADQGLGLPADALTRIFEPFVRVGGASGAGPSGMGLGLHICREIVRGHGGEIWAESDGPNRGSRFHVRLPYRAKVAEVKEETPRRGAVDRKAEKRASG